MLAVLDPVTRAAGTERLRTSLTSGDWEARYGYLRSQTSIDLGYRLIVAAS